MTDPRQIQTSNDLRRSGKMRPRAVSEEPLVTSTASRVVSPVAPTKFSKHLVGVTGLTTPHRVEANRIEAHRVETSAQAQKSSKSQRLRIAMVAPPWIEVPPEGYGGVEATCGTLIEGLIERGHDVTLISVGKNGTSARHKQTHPSAQFSRFEEVLPEITHAAMVQRILANGEYDIVHDHTKAGGLCAPLRNAPTVTTVHNPVQGPVYGELGDYYFHLGDSVNLISISEAQQAARPELNWVDTVYNGLDVQDFPFNPTPGDYVLWLARYTSEKGPDLAIQIAREAGVPLVMVGRAAKKNKGNEECEVEYFNEVIKPMAGKDVELIVNAGREHVIDLVHNARALLHPVRFREPFGMALVEAMACGTPVIGLNRGALPEVVEDGVTGWLRDEPTDLVELVQRVDEIDRHACRARVEEHFSAPAMAAGYERAYYDMIARHEARKVTAEISAATAPAA